MSSSEYLFLQPVHRLLRAVSVEHLFSHLWRYETRRSLGATGVVTERHQRNFILFVYLFPRQCGAGRPGNACSSAASSNEGTPHPQQLDPQAGTSPEQVYIRGVNLKNGKK